jgi:ABC-2 type transport system permease protein
MTLGLLLLAAAVAAACWALLSLADARVRVVFAVTVLGGAAVTLGFALAPVLASVSDPLDPRRFAILGIAPTPLAAALLAAGLVSVPIFALTAVGASAGVLWAEQGAPVAATVLGVILAVVTGALLARVSTALTSLFLRQRRSRELSGLFILALLVVVVPVGVFLASLEWRGTVPSQLEEAIEALAVTPLGAAWAYPGLVATGAESAPLALMIALLTALALGGLWFWLVRVLLTTAERPTSVRERGGLGWFAVAPGTPGGAVSARSLLYWLGDRRYIVNLLVVPVAAGLTVVPLLVAGVPPEIVALVPVPLAALFLGWLPHNDLAYDSTAVWMHIASGVRGASDRIGRLVPVLLIGVPVLAIAVPIAVSLHGRWAVLPAMTGLCAVLFLSGLGLSSISSATWPYAVTRPGDSPFQQPQRTGSGGALAQAFVMLGALALSAPAAWWGWLSLGGDEEAATLALWGGLAIGGATALIGIAIGAAVFERRGSRIMEFAEAS